MEDQGSLWVPVLTDFGRMRSSSFDLWVRMSGWGVGGGVERGGHGCLASVTASIPETFFFFLNCTAVQRHCVLLGKNTHNSENKQIKLQQSVSQHKTVKTVRTVRKKK